MNELTVGFLVTGEAVLNLRSAKEAFDRAYSKLREMKLRVVKIEEVVVNVDGAREAAKQLRKSDADCLIVLAGTFTEDPVVVEVAQKLDIPIVLWAIPEPGLYEVRNKEVDVGSLVGVMMNASALTKIGRKFKVVFGHPDDARLLKELSRTLDVVRVMKKLRDSRIGLVGSRAPGFYDATFDEVLLRKSVGAETVHVDLSELYSQMEKVTDQEAERVIGGLLKKGCSIGDASDSQQKREARIYLSLKKLADQYNFDALAVKCWPELQFSSCLSLGLLSDEGLPAGCEGDVNGTVTMLILYYFTRRPVFFCDVFHLDRERGSILTYHCGAAAPSLARSLEEVKLMKHPLGEGVTAEFPVKEGAVTIARLGSISGRYRMLIAGGEALETDQIVRGNPLEVKLTVDVFDFLKQMASKGIEHHYLIVSGDVRKELMELCEWLDIEKVLLS